jgi:hypothetical protein
MRGLLALWQVSADLSAASLSGDAATPGGEPQCLRLMRLSAGGIPENIRPLRGPQFSIFHFPFSIY